MRLAGIPTYIPQGFVDLLIKLILPIAHPSEIVTPGKTTELAPIITCFSKTTLPCVTFRNSSGIVGLVREWPEKSSTLEKIYVPQAIHT